MTTINTTVVEAYRQVAKQSTLSQLKDLKRKLTRQLAYNQIDSTIGDVHTAYAIAADIHRELTQREGN